MSPVYIGSTKISNAHLGSTGLRSIHLGNVVVWPEVSSYTVEFTASNPAWVIPWWADKLYVICLGGGGGSNGNSSVASGGGGGAGQWQAATLTRATHFPTAQTSTVTLAVTVGAGGLGVGPSFTGGSNNAALKPENDGKSSTVVGGNGVSVSATGGKGAAGQGITYNGYSPGNYVYQGATYVGGLGGSNPTALASPPPANPPGCGGNGPLQSVSVYRPGTNGADGRVWIVVVPPV